MDNELLVEWICPKCGQPGERDEHIQNMCTACAKAYNSRITYKRRHQDDWPALAKESGLELWEQQPGETQWEFTIWSAYRDSYPGKKPSYADVAKQLDCSYEAVKKTAQRWSFPMRMQAWMVECDKITLLQRRQEILDMNKEHIDMAARLRQKLRVAIDAIEPELLKPSEIASLARVAEDMERKARVDTIAQEEMRKDLLVDVENPELKKSQTKQSDLSEVVQILMKAGALGGITHVGVKETKTTEVVVADASGASSSIEMEE